jgi:hypothetical protein
MATLGLLAEDLALKPGQLLLELGDAREQFRALGSPLRRGVDDVTSL